MDMMSPDSGINESKQLLFSQKSLHEKSGPLKQPPLSVTNRGVSGGIGMFNFTGVQPFNSTQQKKNAVPQPSLRVS
jgi:hypothetical protein